MEFMQLTWPSEKSRLDEDSLFVPESFHQGMMSIGIRPTIADNRRTIEVNIFDFNEDIYGRIVRVYVKYFLRNEEKFDSMEDLKKQISLDEINAKKLLSGNESLIKVFAVNKQIT